MIDFEDATFIRDDHDTEHPFTVISRALPRDRSISPDCRLLIIFLLTHDNKWVIKTSPLLKEFKSYWGKDKFYNVLNEAINAGYLQREEYFLNNLTRYRYRIFETPKNKELKKSFRYPDFQDPGGPDPENPDAIRNSNSTNSLRSSVEKKKKQSADAPCALEAFGSFVKLSREDYDKFVSTYGEAFVKDLIEQINDYLASSGKKPYKDFSAAMRQWIRRKDASGSGQPKRSDELQANADFAKTVKSAFSYVVRSKEEIYLGPDYIELGRDPSVDHIDFKSKAFKERVISKLRKMGYPVEGL